MAARNWTGKWAGGRTFTNAKGEPRWVLERERSGRLFVRTLEVNSEKDALAELALFDREPEVYITPKQAKAQLAADALVIEKESVAKVLAFLRKQGNSEKYCLDVVRYLGDWAADLKGSDLKKLMLKDLMKPLNARTTARQKRIAAIKSFTSYYREQEASLTLAEDPTASLMSIPSRPEKAKRSKGYAMELVERTYRALDSWENERTEPDRFGRSRPLGPAASAHRDGGGDPQTVRDYFVLRSKCGMHHSEIDRIATGKGELSPVDHPVIKGALKFEHKSGWQHVLSVDAQTFAAAQRLAAKGKALSESYLATSLRFAAKRLAAQEAKQKKLDPEAAKKLVAAAEPLNPSELRHSFGTWAAECGTEVRPKQGGVSLESIAAVLGHRSARTSGLFYVGVRIPAMVTVPIKLFHPDDPPIAKKPAKVSASTVGAPKVADAA